MAKAGKKPAWQSGRGKNMNTKFRKFTKILAFLIVIAMVVTSLTFLITPVAFGAEKENTATTNTATKEERLEILSKYIDYIIDNYKDKISSNTLLDGAFKGVTEAMNDRFAEYYTTSEAAQEFKDAIENTTIGIGIVFDTEGDTCNVLSVFSDSPAEKAGLLAGDIITKIDGKSTAGLTTTELQALMKNGDIGTKVVLSIDRNGRAMNFTVIRGIIGEQAVKGGLCNADPSVGYIRITSIDSDSSEEFANEVSYLTKNGAKGFIIDLRDNGGGFTNRAVEIADRILKDGVITKYVTQGRIYYIAEATASQYMTEPVVVLVNENTASAAELLAGALHDNGCALVGCTTYGKGESQNVIGFADGTAAKISVQYFTTPNGDDIQEKGITPDYVIYNRLSEPVPEVVAAYEGFAPMSENEKPVVGSKGLNVYGAQQRLALLGYYKGKVDGTMTRETADAVKFFQKEAGLYSYGALDFTTMKMLDELTYDFVHKTSTEDLQFAKALELVQTKKASRK